MRIRELDGLRFLAIFSVFMVHFRPPARAFDFLSLGWAGVDLFFAISGFLITGILIKLRTEPHPFRTFYWRRMLRIFPPYYAALAIIILLAIAHREVVPRLDAFESATFLSSIDLGYSFTTIWARLFGHAGFGSTATQIVSPQFHFFSSGLGVFWSLSVEEAFYLLWAPVILKGSRRTITFFSIAPLFLCPALRALLHTTSYPEVFSFFCRFDSLAAGGCVALAFAAVDRGMVRGGALKRSLLGLLPTSAILFLILIWQCGFFRGIEPRTTIAFAIFGYTLLAIMFASATGACALWAGSRATVGLRLRPLTYLGQISYSMYLIHIPVYVGAGIILRGLMPGAVAQGLFAILCTITIAGFSWKYFEGPILRMRERPLATRAAVAG